MILNFVYAETEGEQSKSVSFEALDNEFKALGARKYGSGFVGPKIDKKKDGGDKAPDQSKVIAASKDVVKVDMDAQKDLRNVDKLVNKANLKEVAGSEVAQWIQKTVEEAKQSPQGVVEKLFVRFALKLSSIKEEEKQTNPLPVIAYTIIVALLKLLHSLNIVRLSNRALEIGETDAATRVKKQDELIKAMNTFKEIILDSKKPWDMQCADMAESITKNIKFLSPRMTENGELHKQDRDRILMVLKAGAEVIKEFSDQMMNDIKQGRDMSFSRTMKAVELRKITEEFGEFCSYIGDADLTRNYENLFPYSKRRDFGKVIDQQLVCRVAEIKDALPSMADAKTRDGALNALKVLVREQLSERKVLVMVNDNPVVLVYTGNPQNRSITGINCCGALVSCMISADNAAMLPIDDSGKLNVEHKDFVILIGDVVPSLEGKRESVPAIEAAKSEDDWLITVVESFRDPSGNVIAEYTAVIKYSAYRKLQSHAASIDVNMPDIAPGQMLELKRSYPENGEVVPLVTMLGASPAKGDEVILFDIIVQLVSKQCGNFSIVITKNIQDVKSREVEKPVVENAPEEGKEAEFIPGVAEDEEEIELNEEKFKGIIDRVSKYHTMRFNPSEAGDKVQVKQSSFCEGIKPIHPKDMVLDLSVGNDTVNITKALLLSLGLDDEECKDALNNAQIHSNVPVPLMCQDSSGKVVQKILPRHQIMTDYKLKDSDALSRKLLLSIDSDGIVNVTHYYLNRDGEPIPQATRTFVYNPKRGQITIKEFTCFNLFHPATNSKSDIESGRYFARDKIAYDYEPLTHPSDVFGVEYLGDSINHGPLGFLQNQDCVDAVTKGHAMKRFLMPWENTAVAKSSPALAGKSPKDVRLKILSSTSEAASMMCESNVSRGSMWQHFSRANDSKNIEARFETMDNRIAAQIPEAEHNNVIRDTARYNVIGSSMSQGFLSADAAALCSVGITNPNAGGIRPQIRRFADNNQSMLRNTKTGLGTDPRVGYGQQAGTTVIWGKQPKDGLHFDDLCLLGPNKDVKPTDSRAIRRLTNNRNAARAHIASLLQANIDANVGRPHYLVPISINNLFDVLQPFVGSGSQDVAYNALHEALDQYNRAGLTAWARAGKMLKMLIASGAFSNLNGDMYVAQGNVLGGSIPNEEHLSYMQEGRGGKDKFKPEDPLTLFETGVVERCKILDTIEHVNDVAHSGDLFEDFDFSTMAIRAKFSDDNQNLTSDLIGEMLGNHMKDMTILKLSTASPLSCDSQGMTRDNIAFTKKIDDVLGGGGEEYAPDFSLAPAGGVITPLMSADSNSAQKVFSAVSAKGETFLEPAAMILYRGNGSKRAPVDALFKALIAVKTFQTFGPDAAEVVLQTLPNMACMISGVGTGIFKANNDQQSLAIHQLMSNDFSIVAIDNNQNDPYMVECRALSWNDKRRLVLYCAMHLMLGSRSNADALAKAKVSAGLGNVDLRCIVKEKTKLRIRDYNNGKVAVPLREVLKNGGKFNMPKHNEVHEDRKKECGGLVIDDVFVYDLPRVLPAHIMSEKQFVELRDVGSSGRTVVSEEMAMRLQLKASLFMNFMLDLKARGINNLLEINSWEQVPVKYLSIFPELEIARANRCQYPSDAILSIAIKFNLPVNAVYQLGQEGRVFRSYEQVDSTEPVVDGMREIVESLVDTGSVDVEDILQSKGVIGNFSGRKKLVKLGDSYVKPAMCKEGVLERDTVLQFAEELKNVVGKSFETATIYEPKVLLEKVSNVDDLIAVVSECVKKDSVVKELAGCMDPSPNMVQELEAQWKELDEALKRQPFDLTPPRSGLEGGERERSVKQPVPGQQL